MNLTIYEFDKNNDFIKRIEAKSANINTFTWLLNDVTIINSEGKILSDQKNITYPSNYNYEKINSVGVVNENTLVQDRDIIIS